MAWQGTNQNGHSNSCKRVEGISVQRNFINIWDIGNGWQWYVFYISQSPSIALEKTFLAQWQRTYCFLNSSMRQQSWGCYSYSHIGYVVEKSKEIESLVLWSTLIDHEQEAEFSLMTTFEQKQIDPRFSTNDMTSLYLLR